MPLNNKLIPLIKICGITQLEDALLAAKLGANALGFIFAQNSPRVITVEIAKQVLAALPPFITLVGVFADMPAHDIAAILNQVPLQVLQFHGDETEADCKQYGKAYIKAFRIKPDCNINELIDQYPTASAVLLDSYHPQLLGGTGLTFNWQAIPANLTKPIILAGGLTPTNAAQAIRQAKPYAIDVCSGVELYPGKKDPTKLTAFFNEVKRVYHTEN